MPRPDSVAALTVLFTMRRRPIERTVAASTTPCGSASRTVRCSRFVLAFGDASPEPLFSAATWRGPEASAPAPDEVQLRVLRREHRHLPGAEPARPRTPRADVVLLCNPDIVPEARALDVPDLEMLADERVGLVEAKQLPVEHPKRLRRRDRPHLMGLGRVLDGAAAGSSRRLGGFDEKTFFLYCDDVDLSWRIREAGYDVVNQPAAVVFHDKEVSATGRLDPHRGRALLLRRGRAAAGAQVVARRHRGGPDGRAVATSQDEDHAPGCRGVPPPRRGPARGERTTPAQVVAGSSTATTPTTGTRCDRRTATTGRPGTGPRYDRCAGLVGAHADIKPGAVHLDLACGTAALAESIQALGLTYVGIDADPEAVEVTRERGVEAHVVDLGAPDAAQTLDDIIGERPWRPCRPSTAWSTSSTASGCST